MDVAARLEFLHEQRNERCLDQAAFVVARLVPGIGEENMHAIQRLRADHVAQHFHGVVLDDADVADLLLIDQFEQIAHAGRMHLKRKVVVLGVCQGDRCGAVAHAETDFQHLRRSAPEGLIEIERLCFVGNAEARQQRLHGTLLRGRNAALAQHVAADMALTRVGGVGHGVQGTNGRSPAAFG